MDTQSLKSDWKIYKPVPVSDALDQEKSKQESLVRPIIGYLLGLLLALAACLTGLFIKLAPHFDASNQSALAYFIQLIVMLVFVKVYHQPVFGPKEQRGLLILRGTTASAGVILVFFSIRYLDISDIETLGNSAVIITAILSRIFLSEKLTISHIIALILTISGVVFIVRPSFLFGLEQKMEHMLHINLTDTNHTHSLEIKDHSNRTIVETLIGVTIVLLSAVCFSITQIAVKKLCNVKAHFAVVSLYPAMIGLPVSIIVSVVLYFTKSSRLDLNQDKNVLLIEFGYSLLAGFFGISCNLLLIYALRYEDATKIAMVKTFGVLFSFVLQYIFLDTIVDLLGIIGAAIIITAILFVLSLKVLDSRLSKSKNCFIKLMVKKF